MKKYSIFLTALVFFLNAVGQPTLPPAPGSCNASSCITNSTIDVCPVNSNTVVSNFQNKAMFTNTGNGGRSAGSVWRYRGMANVTGQTINAVVTIDAISNAALDDLDDDAATDQGGGSISGFFAPRIGPDQNLNGTDRRGYVQFTIAFFKNSAGVNDNTSADFAMPVALANLNYVHYDIDGSDAGNVNTGVAGSWFRETGVAQRISVSNPVVLGNLPTELVSYTYTQPAGINWVGFAGSICERSGVSKCAQVASAFQYTGSQLFITFRMGYDYNAGGNMGAPIRQYGSRLGCFEFPQQSTLPVKLLSFTGNYRNETTYLNWETEDQVNFDHFEIERSSNGTDFLNVGNKQAVNNTGRSQYQFNDDLSHVSGNIFYYRLKIIDINGKFKYSNVILIRKDQKAINGITISPNPVTNGLAMVKMSSSFNSIVELRVIDLSGKIVLRQQNKVMEGNNTLSINNLDRLQPGIYTIQLINNENISISKFSLVK